jgi:hypothetical protein
MNVFRRRYGRALRTAKRSMQLVRTDDGIAEIDERDAAVRTLAGPSPRQRAAVVLVDLLGFRSERGSSDARYPGFDASHADLSPTPTLRLAGPVPRRESRAEPGPRPR